MIRNIIGRKREQDILRRIYESEQSEFVAVCGRRRVGKTFLVREYFEDQMVFQLSGLANGSTQKQLRNFYYTLRRFDNTVKESEDERGAQIDLVIERADNTINLCEIKFSESDFEITKDYDAVLRNKIGRFRDETKTKKSIQLTFITTYGICKNIYSSTAQNEVKMDDLFRNE